MKIEDNRNSKSTCNFEELTNGTVFELIASHQIFIKCRACMCGRDTSVNAVALKCGDSVHIDKHAQVISLSSAKVVIE